jgi:short-subunit dehydrogenase
MRPGAARVVLTGAGGGIGRAIAQALLGAGAAVLLVGRTPRALEALARGLQESVAASGDDVAPNWHAADLTDPAAFPALAEAAAGWDANVLINAAGVPAFGALEKLPAAQLEAVLQVNLLAPMRLAQALLPWFKCLPRAQIINIGSALGRLGMPGYSVYCASKFGLRGFSEALRRELAGGPVKVQYLGPRSTRTAFNSAEVEAYNRATGTRSDSPETVAAALLQLLDDESAERFLGFPERVAVRVNGLAPAALDGAFASHRRSLAQPAPPAPAASDARP